jgi:hypothetical protein
MPKKKPYSSRWISPYSPVDEMADKVAFLFNHGLSDKEAYAELVTLRFHKPELLIGVIRKLMEAK